MRTLLIALSVVAITLGLVVSVRAVVAVRKRVDDDEFREARDMAWDRFAQGTGLSAGMALLGAGVALFTIALVI
jgi:uncharacterized membrane protein